MVSALQVMKHPIRTPGPSAGATPNKGRRFPACHLTQTAWSETATTATTLTMTDMNWMSDGRQSKLTGGFSTLSNTPLNSPLPHRPHHSPKIKLKSVPFFNSKVDISTQYDDEWPLKTWKFDPITFNVIELWQNE